MKTTILWTGQAYNSLENCQITQTNKGTEVRSVIVGYYEDKIFRVDYLIETNKNWEVTFVEVTTQLDHRVRTISLQSDARRGWTKNGKAAKQFSGCTDVDISLTPFTNSLPVNRLKFHRQKEQKIKVVYFDILEQKLKPVFQKYIKLADNKYKFENVPNDFEAVIKFDEQGLVRQYPGLFKRLSKR